MCKVYTFPQTGQIRFSNIMMIKWLIHPQMKVCLDLCTPISFQAVGFWFFCKAQTFCRMFILLFLTIKSTEMDALRHKCIIKVSVCYDPSRLKAYNNCVRNRPKIKLNPNLPYPKNNNKKNPSNLICICVYSNQDHILMLSNTIVFCVSHSQHLNMQKWE